MTGAGSNWGASTVATRRARGSLAYPDSFFSIEARIAFFSAHRLAGTSLSSKSEVCIADATCIDMLEAGAPTLRHVATSELYSLDRPEVWQVQLQTNGLPKLTSLLWHGSPQVPL